MYSLHTGPASNPSPSPYDLAVVGGGIIGLATAREVALRHPDMKIAVVEKEEDLGGFSGYSWC